MKNKKINCFLGLLLILELQIAKKVYSAGHNEQPASTDSIHQEKKDEQIEFNLELLPKGIIDRYVFSYLSPEERIKFRLVSKHMKVLVDASPFIDLKFYIRHTGDLNYFDNKINDKSFGLEKVSDLDLNLFDHSVLSESNMVFLDKISSKFKKLKKL